MARKKTKKRSLVLSGGGSRGAWQAGAIKALIQDGKWWDTIHGVSVGSLNGAFLAMHTKEELQQEIKLNKFELEHIWNSIKNSDDIYRPWSKIKPINYLFSVVKGSLNSGEPLKKLLTSMWKPEKKTVSRFTVGCTDLTTGMYKVVNDTHGNFTDFLLASSHLPIVFQPIQLDFGWQTINTNGLWVDGGIRHQIPFEEALLENSDEIDVVLTSPIFVEHRFWQKNIKTSSTPKIALRASEIMSDQIYQSDVQAILKEIKTNKKCKITIYAPTYLPVQDSMEFCQKTIKKNFENGYIDVSLKLKETQDKKLKPDVIT